MRPFADRADAGRRLGQRLIAYAGRPDVTVVGLPRGGVPVAAEVARLLQAPLDILLVRKLGVPDQPELAMGAIAEGGIEILDSRLIADLAIPRSLVDEVASREHLELGRAAQRYRVDRPPPHVEGRVVIVVDDGLATGATMEAAIVALRRRGPSAVIAAAPVGARDTCRRLREITEGVECVETPAFFHAVGLWYDDFSQTTDDEVIRLLTKS